MSGQNFSHTVSVVAGVAVTEYKSQGLTLDTEVVDFGLAAGCTDVELTRHELPNDDIFNRGSILWAQKKTKFFSRLSLKKTRLP